MAKRPKWKIKPKLSPAQVKKKWGPNARLVRMGGGGYTVAKATKGPGFESGPGPATPPAPTGPASAPPPPAPQPPPRDPAIDASLADIARRIDAAPGVFNERRRNLALNNQRGLTDAGFFENVGLGERTEGRNTAFDLVLGPEGQTFRDTRQDLIAQANRRGMLASSGQRRGQRIARTGLENQVAGVQRQFGQEQAGITQSQTDYLNDLREAQTQSDIAQQQFGASSPVALPDPAPPQAGEPGGPALPRNLIKLGPNRTRQQAQQVGQREFGADKFKVGRPGGGGGLVIKRI